MRNPQTMHLLKYLFLIISFMIVKYLFLQVGVFYIAVNRSYDGGIVV